jgi:hypothetical protein
MKDSNSSIDNNSNKDSDSSINKEILLDISEELKKENVVSEIKYFPAQKSLKIIFSTDYDNFILDIPGDVKNWYSWMDKIELKIKKEMPKLNGNQRILIENTIKNNINEIFDATENRAENLRNNNQKENEEIDSKVKTGYLKKYVFEGKLYESILLNNVPKFITLPSSSQPSSNNSNESDNKPDDISFKLYDKIDIPGYTFFPNDTIVTRNPIPYSFESEDELKKYIELAKNETFDTLFEKILMQIRDYVNIYSTTKIQG